MGSFLGLCGGQGPCLTVLRGSSLFANSSPPNSMQAKVPLTTSQSVSQPCSPASCRPATRGRWRGRGPFCPGVLLLPQMWFVCGQKIHSVTTLVFKIKFLFKSIASLSFQVFIQNIVFCLHIYIQILITVIS